MRRIPIKVFNSHKTPVLVITLIGIGMAFFCVRGDILHGISIREWPQRNFWGFFI